MSSVFREVLGKPQLSVCVSSKPQTSSCLKLIATKKNRLHRPLPATCLYYEVTPEVLSVLGCRATFSHNNRSDFEATRQNFTNFSRWSELCLFLWLGSIDGLGMVKVSFNSALGRNEVRKDAEILLPEEPNVSRKWPSDAVLGEAALSGHAP